MSNEEHSPNKKKRKIIRTDEILPGWVWITFFVICLGIGVRSCNEKSKAGKPQALEHARMNPPPAQVMTVTRKPWSFKTMEIPNNGLAVYLYQGWKVWPKGGSITITTPAGNVLKDQPGVKNNFGYQPEGIYIFRADPEGSEREVQIYNRW